MIQITEKAVQRALTLSRKEGKPPFLRVGVRGGGCSGLSYVLDFVDTIMAEDTVLELGELRVLCDPKSLKFLEEMELDYDSNLLNGGFRFNNPKARKTCSCGESFSV